MTNPRQRMLERVRAILSKTMDNGCTESEAMAALAKAQELMAAYDISEAELGHTTETESALIHKDATDDPYKIKAYLAQSVAKFTRCKGWRGNTYTNYSIAFAGLESDVAFAQWLLDTLARFVLRELKAHQAKRRALGMACPRIVSASFVMGCATRIGERLKELTPVEPIAATGNALTISRQALIRKAMADAGIVLRAAQNRRRHVDGASYGAGVNAGNNARFDRPVSGSNAGPLRLT